MTFTLNFWPIQCFKIISFLHSLHRILMWRFYGIRDSWFWGSLCFIMNWIIFTLVILTLRSSRLHGSFVFCERTKIHFLTSVFVDNWASAPKVIISQLKSESFLSTQLLFSKGLLTKWDPQMVSILHQNRAHFRETPKGPYINYVWMKRWNLKKG